MERLFPWLVYVEIHLRMVMVPWLIGSCGNMMSLVDNNVNATHFSSSGTATAIALLLLHLVLLLQLMLLLLLLLR